VRGIRWDLKFDSILEDASNCTIDSTQDQNSIHNPLVAARDCLQRRIDETNWAVSHYVGCKTSGIIGPLSHLDSAIRSRGDNLLGLTGISPPGIEGAFSSNFEVKMTRSEFNQEIALGFSENEFDARVIFVKNAPMRFGIMVGDRLTHISGKTVSNEQHSTILGLLANGYPTELLFLQFHRSASPLKIESIRVSSAFETASIFITLNRNMEVLEPSTAIDLILVRIDEDTEKAKVSSPTWIRLQSNDVRGVELNPECARIICLEVLNFEKAQLLSNMGDRIIAFGHIPARPETAIKDAWVKWKENDQLLQAEALNLFKYVISEKIEVQPCCSRFGLGSWSRFCVSQKMIA
jgi:hypothetical protein